MQQAQKLQENMERAQREIAELEVTGEAGGGLVRATVNGAHEVKRVEIDRELLRDDPDMVEDLVAAACNAANAKLAETSKEKMGELTGGMKLPPGFKLPL